MMSKSLFSVSILAAAIVALTVPAIAQETTGEDHTSTWGQIKSMYESGPTLPKGVAASAITIVEEPKPIPLTPLEQEILSLGVISGTSQQVSDAVRELGFAIEPYKDEDDADRQLCRFGEGMANSRLTDEGERPAIYRYRIIDNTGATVRYGFYSVPVATLATGSSNGEGSGAVAVTWWDTRFRGSRKHWQGSYSYVGWWWNDETSSLLVGYSTTHDYYRFYKDSRYRGGSLLVYQNESISSLCPIGWNDKISSMARY